MRKKIFVIATLSVIGFIKVEALWNKERLSWIVEDSNISRSMFTPYNLSKGKEVNRNLPWIFHDAEEKKVMELKCLMTGYNASLIDYKRARWSYPGFDDSQVDTSCPAEIGNDYGEPG